MLRVFNTLTRKKEEFIPIKQGEVRMYSCGLTVYGFGHIGNFRAFIASDLISRYLKYKGYKVTKVINITDVDDKTIRGAIKEGVSLNKYTEKYIKGFFDDINTLNVDPANYYPKATDYIKEIVELIEKLKAKGHTYEQDGSIYFKISSDKNYGKLAHLDFSKLVDNAQGRLDSDEYDKDNARDFVLWKGYKETDGEIFWNTKLGKGRPGWHIECSAMSTKLLGDSFDIHTGGVDLIFPHHTNEIAQSENATCKHYVKYWLHNEYLKVEGEKMSKSLGNFFTLKDLLEKGLDPIAIRYELLATNYRMPLNFTIDGVGASKVAIEKLNNFVWELTVAKEGKLSENIEELIKSAKDNFESAMDDDFNISRALASIFDFMKSIFKEGFTSADSKLILSFLKSIDSVLGVISFERDTEIDKNIEQLIEQRNIARKNKDFTTSDRIRDDLLKKGIELLDGPEGTKWRKK